MTGKKRLIKYNIWTYIPYEQGLSKINYEIK